MDLQRLDEIDADNEGATGVIKVSPDAIVARFSDEDKYDTSEGEDVINDD